MNAEETAKFMTSQASAMERELAMSRNETRKHVADKRALKEEVANAKRSREEEERNMTDITKNMTRQYKCMQENLLKQITDAHQTIEQLKKQLKIARGDVERTKDETRKALASKDRVIANQKLKMEEMASEFADMLKETLEAMRNRIEVSDDVSKHSGAVAAEVVARK